MTEISDYIEIKSPRRFLDVVENLKELVEAGVLKEIEGGYYKLAQIKPNDFPYDVIEILFESTNDKIRYKLVCNTQHGTGGYFKKLSAWKVD